ncbi:hybrid signal transduction histidine kinase k [Fusarium longipes]|uniref:Hybrid signal transduction histidine kinase k n=1 Tax=Fusarium longipes TaxID=694270 RepID=A0A395SKV9_9HYPO|nr:hybrid signal transduction histidine kinase k [Fusarium longipes]
MESDIADDLDTLNIRDILNADSRPTFIIDLDPDDESPLPSKIIQPVFCNTALTTHERLFDWVRGEETCDAPTEPVSYLDFKSWATGITTQDDSKDVYPLFFLYKDLLWTGSTVAKRWRLISGNRLWQHATPPGALSSSALSRASTPGIRDHDQAKQKDQDSKPPKQEPELEAKNNVFQSPTEMTSPELPSTDSTLVVSSQRKESLKSWWRAGTSRGSSDRITGSSGNDSFILGKPEKAVADWTAAKPKGLLTPYIKLLRDIDWSVTPLGAMDTWSPELRQVANLVIANPHPASLFWGSDMTMLYNEQYAIHYAGNKHPSMLGTGASGPWSEAWDVLGSAFAEVIRTGISHRSDNDELSLFRRGFLEETHICWSLTPLYGGTGRICGFYNAPFETTDLILSQRRMATINRLGESLRKATSIRSFWKLVLEGLEDNHKDVPFALVYSVGEAEEGDHQSSSSGSTISSKSCYLEGTIGIPRGHPAAPDQIDLKRSHQGFVPSFREAMRTRSEPTLVRIRDGSLPEDILQGIQWRGYVEAGSEAIIFPIRPTNGENVLAFLVLGVNPRRPYDEGYKSFASLLNNQLATSLASIILFEDETRRGRDAVEAAALEKEELTQQIKLQASRLRRMTELSPLGMFLTSPEGILREANDKFYEMTGHTRDPHGDMAWVDLMGTSGSIMEEGWHRLTQELLPWSGEVKLRKAVEDPVNIQGESIDCWVLVTAHPEMTVGGTLRSIMGSITDISHLKWAEGLQNRRLQEAEETRRQQNEFIDITSHEMRNPLSAILQCADDITAAMEAARSSGLPTSRETLDSCLDASQTIALCVQHQKSIVDDILTVSKLDSNLLLITPVVCQPQAIIERVVKMFESETVAKDITLKIQIQESFRDLAVDWVAMDPSRVLQILINLMTNAIKFTASSPRRVIEVTVGVSGTPPGGNHTPGFAFAPTRGELGNVVSSDEWGTGEALYVHYRVQDTGCGLSETERQLLFQRFKQASPRTHAKYGGSGLGLFISKRLAELHGGRIGVASVAGQGSDFGFYVQARRSSAPDQPSLSQTPSSKNSATAGPSRSLSDEPYILNSTNNRRRHGSDEAFDPRDLTIHIVEDNLINQKVLVNQLRKVGCTVSATNDGVEALEFLRKTHFYKQDGSELSVVLMDLEMPNMDGLTCVSEIRRMQKEGQIIEHVPVIAVTANVRDEQIRVALESGMDDLVSKPFRIPEVMSKIDKLLRKYNRY